MKVFRFKQFTVCQDHAAMKVGTDSDLLGALAHGGRRILDIGTGTGVLALMMAQRFGDAQIAAVEIDDKAIVDAKANFDASPWGDRIKLTHSSFQDYAEEQPPQSFDALICNPPYFEKSLECPDVSRTTARHASSLPFDVLVESAYRLLADGGVFSVILPPEVYESFDAECHTVGFVQKMRYEIHTVPHKPVKRYVIVYLRGWVEAPRAQTCCMHNPDLTYTEWYGGIMSDFLLHLHN